jgi:hypothetical protein
MKVAFQVCWGFSQSECSMDGVTQKPPSPPRNLFFSPTQAT